MALISDETLIPVAEYLATSYRPDFDYVDGRLVERNWGEWDHSRLQAVLLRTLLGFEQKVGILVVPEQRVRVLPYRFRVPDFR